MFAAIIGHADFGRAEGVGFDHIRARLKISGMNCADNVGARDRQQVVISLLIMRQIKVTAIIGFRQFVPLNRGAIAAVKYQDLLRRTINKGRTRAHAATSCASAAGRFPSRWQMA